MDTRRDVGPRQRELLAKIELRGELFDCSLPARECRPDLPAP